MGLRERNAAQTRELILDTALPLFLEQGYEATRMEEIAERADIGTSTLYRYFPTKDALVLEPLAIHGQMAATLLSRPADEPLDLTLGHAVLALLIAPRGNAQRLREVHAVIATAPVLSARLHQEFVKERTLLEHAIAERLGRPTDDLFCLMTARTAAAVLELVAARAGDVSDDPAIREQQVRDLTQAVTAQIHQERPILPRIDLPATATPTGR